MAHTIALYGGKPRVGKTTAAMNLAVLAARAGQQTALVHIDEGWPAAKTLGAAPAEGLVRDVRPGLDLAMWAGDEKDLPDRCRSLAAQVDLVLIDVPAAPEVAKGLLGCADEVILLAGAGKEALRGLAEDLGLVTDVLADGQSSLEVAGLLMTLADRKLTSFERFLVQAERAFPVDVFPYCVPRADHRGEEDGLAVESAATGRRARAYVELAMEVLNNGG